MIPNKEGCHHFSAKKLSALLRGIMSKEIGDCHCLNRLHSFRVKKLESHIMICGNKDFGKTLMPS